MGVPAAKVEPEPLASARVKVRPKAQLTLPEEISRALHIGEGDEVEFAVHGDGTITVRGYVSIPTDQAWFFTPQWLAGEREADEEIEAGRGTATGPLTICSRIWMHWPRTPDADLRDVAAFRERLEGPLAPAAGAFHKVINDAFVPDLTAPDRPFRPGLRVKGVTAHPDVFEMTWDNDGRATFSYGEERVPGQPMSSGAGSAPTTIFTPPPGP